MSLPATLMASSSSTSRLWDYAAGAVIAREAGAEVAFPESAHGLGPAVVVANGSLMAPLLGLLAEAGALAAGDLLRTASTRGRSVAKRAQEAGFSTIDSKRIAPVASSRTRNKNGWSMTIGCSVASVADIATPTPVAAAAVVPFGVTCR